MVGPDSSYSPFEIHICWNVVSRQEYSPSVCSLMTTRSTGSEGGLAYRSRLLLRRMLRVSGSPVEETDGVVRIPFRHKPFLAMESTTVSTGVESAEWTSLMKYTSKSTGTEIDLNTSSTLATSSGPTPSPGMRVAVIRSSALALIILE